MPKRSLIEQLDNAVQAMLTNPSVMPATEDPSLAPLLRIATDLRSLPREEFKASLKQDLQRRSEPEKPATTETKVNPIREGFRTITPYLVVNEAAELIEFVKQAFGAEERFRSIGGAGGIHCELKIGDSMMMLGGGANWKGTPMPSSIHLYVPNADEVYERALKAGAVSLHELTDQPYGDREGSVRDRAGNHWYIGTNKETGGPPTGMNTVTACLHLREPFEMIDFLKRALGAEELSVSKSPRGMLQHGKLKLGSSVLEIGPAHGPYQPMATMFYLYVEDVDALYRRAVEAGAVSISPPTDQPYGDRSAGVRDPFGNQWYIATHIKDFSG